MMRDHKRRLHLVKKPLQYKFIAWVVGTALVAALVVFLDVFVSLHRHAIDSGLTVRVSDLYNPADPLTLLKVALYAVGVYYASLLLSHRVAGPVYRFERSAEQVSGGDLTSRVFLREGDQLVDLRDAFNGMIDALRGKVAGDVSSAHKAKRLLEGLLEESDLPDETVEKVRRAVAEMDRVGKGFRI